MQTINLKHSICYFLYTNICNEILDMYDFFLTKIDYYIFVGEFESYNSYRVMIEFLSMLIFFGYFLSILYVLYKDYVWLGKNI